MKKYDVAISFAEEQRTIALAIAEACKRYGIDSYYYPDRLPENIGRDMNANLPGIYESEAQHAIVLLSEAYLRKKWTQIEWKAIMKRFEQQPNYLILIKVEDISLHGIDGVSEDYVYMSWNNELEPISNLLKTLLGRLESTKETNKDKANIVNDFKGSDIKQVIQVDKIDGLTINNN